MLHVSYSIIDNFVKNLQVEGYDIRITTHHNNPTSVYWMIKLNGHNICRFYGKYQICAVGFKQEYCNKKEWSYFIDNPNDSLNTGKGSFRGYKLHYDKHDFNYYMNWITDHIMIACLLNKWK